MRNCAYPEPVVTIQHDTFDCHLTIAECDEMPIKEQLLICLWDETVEES